MEILLKILGKSVTYLSGKKKVQESIPEGHHVKSYPSQGKLYYGRHLKQFKLSEICTPDGILLA